MKQEPGSPRSSAAPTRRAHPHWARPSPEHSAGPAVRATDVVALDLDVHADGPARNRSETLRTQLDIQGLEDWPDTLTVMTPSTSPHLYFRVPADCVIGSISGGRSPFGPGIGVRGPGRRSGYLVGPARSRAYPLLPPAAAQCDAPRPTIRVPVGQLLQAPRSWRRAPAGRAAADRPVARQASCSRAHGSSS
ncbi:bifunctional DNA primase/polymerase [Streptomyces sp. NPDC056921]|uniref:bifunctional DNA primase/polymerase n=1 Tax=Streptomyces sp. NPDC056921 TaxID=3345966 RepID=UPI0036394A6D